MPTDVFVKEVQGLTDEQKQQVITFIHFIKHASQKQNHDDKASPEKHRRTPGGMPGKLWMAEDFDETPDCFAEYVC